MSKRFRVALSFSGQKRAFVSEVAAALAERFSEKQILYDRFHQAEFARANLALYLTDLYHHQSDLVVAVLCRDYENKEWCGLEWRAIYGLLKERKDREVMLCRFDLVEGEGLHGLAGFVDFDQMTPQQAAARILERLAINHGLTSGPSAAQPSSTVDWPVTAPVLDWPVADHTAAQRAFASLITRAAPFRFLPIHGGSETGKSHLTKQFLRNALKIPDLVRGRFDFKGSSDMDDELRSFADNLGVPPPTRGSGVTLQLAEVMASLKREARPTLLIFDTFELAGDAARWVKNNLLLETVSAGWLRIIIVGQRVPDPSGEPWEGDAADPVELKPPSPEEWFAYGQAHNGSPKLTLELIRSVHDAVGGKSSVLAQICRSA